MPEPPDEGAESPRAPLAPPGRPGATPARRRSASPVLTAGSERGGRPRRRPRAVDRSRRARGPILIIVLGLLIAGGIVDRTSATPAASSRVVEPAGSMAANTSAGSLVADNSAGSMVADTSAGSMVADTSAVSSTWLCSGAVGSPSGVAKGTLEIANAAATTLRGTVTLVPSTGDKVRLDVAIPPRSRQAVPETTTARAAFVGAVVDLDHGGAAVEQVVVNRDGASVAPCATEGSAHWYFSTGTTLRDATVYLGLLNPYPEDAIVDLSFTTEQGVEQPPDFQGIVLPPESEVGVDLGSHLRRRYQIATTVSARVGRIVAFQTQVVGQPPTGAHVVGNTPPAPGDPNDPVPPVAGLALTLGTPSPSTHWVWPDGLATAGVTGRFEIYNPTSKTAQVRLDFILDQGTAEPLAITVGPEGTASVIANDESRVPKGVGFASVLDSVNGVPVVAERTVADSAPSARSGLGEVFGSTLAARSWMMAAGDANPTTAESIEIYNPTGARVTASVVAVGPSGSSVIAPLVVAAGRRAVVRISPRQQSQRTLMVRATGNVVVERDLYSVGSRGLSLSLAIPLRP